MRIFNTTPDYVQWRLDNNKGIGVVTSITITEKRDPTSKVLGEMSVYQVDISKVQKGMYSSVIFAALDRWSAEHKHDDERSYYEKIKAKQDNIFVPSSFAPYEVYAVDETSGVAYIYGKAV